MTQHSVKWIICCYYWTVVSNGIAMIQWLGYRKVMPHTQRAHFVHTIDAVVPFFAESAPICNLIKCTGPPSLSYIDFHSVTRRRHHWQVNWSRAYPERWGLWKHLFNNKIPLKTKYLVPPSSTWINCNHLISREGCIFEKQHFFPLSQYLWLFIIAAAINGSTVLT